VTAILAACVLGSLAGVPAAVAQPCPKTSLGDVEDEVMCPICGTPLELATEAPQAIRQRELIERLVADCRSKEEIKTRLAAEFGDQVLALPDDSGFDLAAWVVPGLVLLGGGAGVVVAALRWRRRPARAGAAPPQPEGERRLDEDMERYDL
jgi:cytochrome c-type biogenesis protein CcmH